jgi:hypothetical protein
MKWRVGQFLAFGLVNAWLTFAVFITTLAAGKVYRDWDVLPSGLSTAAIRFGFVLPAAGFLFSVIGLFLAFRPSVNTSSLTKSLAIAAFLELFLLGILLIVLFVKVFNISPGLSG